MPRFKTTLVLLTLLQAILFFNNAVANEANIKINNHLFTVELAVSADERSRGLMHRKSLEPNSGMLFIYPEPRIISFWMKQTLIPLDLLYFDKDGQLIESHHNIQPCKLSNCKTYTNKKPAQFALELPAGTTKRLNIKQGNSFTVIKAE